MRADPLGAVLLVLKGFFQAVNFGLQLLALSGGNKGGEAFKQLVNHVVCVKDAVGLMLLRLIVNNKPSLPRQLDDVFAVHCLTS